MAIYLPDKANLRETDDDDPVFYHFNPLIGWVYRKRLENTVALLGDGKYDRLLEIGYGSGLLLPELKRHSMKLYGVDMHGAIPDVQQMLDKEGVEAELVHGTILDLPYETDFFDAIVSVSVLEHIREIDKATSEIRRVLKPGGTAVLSFPTKNKITNSFFRLVGYDPSELHPSSHRVIEEGVSKHFTIEKKLLFPSIGLSDFALYVSLKCLKR
ncbi:MAG: methyltransferase domain-containing protein [Thermodesulfobacteriota bacterium]